MTVETLGRAIQLYRRTATSRSATFLVIANAIPLVGVLFFGWSLLTILVLYWVENGIVGFWNILKINLARGSVIETLPEMPEGAALAATRNPTQAAALRAAWLRARQLRAAQAATTGTGPIASVGRLGLSIFFLFHYGIFWLVHGIFVFALPTFGGGGIGGVFPGAPLGGSDVCFDASGLLVDCGNAGFGEIVWPSVLIGAVALFISHGASFLFNYIGRGEYLTASPGGQMAAVYGRVVILHLTIIFGAFVIAILGTPIGALLVLVVLKTAFDLGLHLRERRSADARVPADTTFGQIIRGDAAPPAPPAVPPA